MKYYASEDSISVKQYLYYSASIKTQRRDAMRLIRILRRAIDRVIDALVIFKSPAGLSKGIVILHGASCAGKSTILLRLKRHYNQCHYIDMDKFRYWEIESGTDELSEARSLLDEAGTDKGLVQEMLHSIEHSHRVPTGKPRNRVMVELLRASLEFDAVAVTCGNLPPPFVADGYYSLLEKCTDHFVIHVLLAPDRHILEQRVRSRGKSAEVEEYVSSNNWWLKNSAAYDLVLNGSESTTDVIDRIRTCLDHKKSTSVS